MATRVERRFGISEVSAMTEVPIHVLRQWEVRFSQLKPKRNRANRRYYFEADISIVRRIKELLWYDKMTTSGAQKRLEQEVRGEGRPQSRQEALDLVDKIESEVRSMLDTLDSS